MRLLVIGVFGLALTAAGSANAQMKLSPKAAAGGGETRYFTSIDGLMEGNADVILKETLQGKNVTSAVLDVCYPAEKGSERKDRFVANLTASGQTLAGTTQSLGDKQPVNVKLVRRPTDDTFEFKGQITIGQVTTQINSSDNSDLSEKEFQESQPTDNGIVAAPKDFTEVSPESIAVKIKLENVGDFLKSLRGQNVELAVSSLAVSCEALRAGEQVINLTIDPERARAFVEQTRSSSGVAAAGWTAGVVDMERTIRFLAADWRDGEKLSRDKIASAVTGVLSKTLSATAAPSHWDENTGQLKMTFKRPSQIQPALGLTESIDVTALVAPDRPDVSDRLMLWVGNPTINTLDETSGPKLHLADTSSNDEEGEPSEDNGSINALAKEFKGQRWDADKSSWK